MQHYFDIEIAQIYGVNAAIILQNLGHWIKRNEANDVNFYDGYYWTFNSRRAYRELFPYMSERQIDTAFRKLIDDGLVITGNYNAQKYDRTLWYALTQKGKCILHFDGMETLKMSNGIDQNVKPIPNINTDNKPDVNTDKKERKKPAASYDEIVAEYTSNEELKLAIIEFIKMRKMMKKPLTDHALRLMFQKVDKLAKNEFEKIAIINQSIVRGWVGVFPLKDGNSYEFMHRATKPEEQKPMSAAAAGLLDLVKGANSK